MVNVAPIQVYSPSLTLPIECTSPDRCLTASAPFPLAQQARLTGRVVSTFCLIVDVGDMGMAKITSEFLWLVQRIAEVDQKHYPERLGAMYVAM